MRTMDPHSILRALLAWDSSRAADRAKFVYPSAGWFDRKAHASKARQRVEDIDINAPLRAWINEHYAAFPALVAIESIVQDIPAALVEGHTRGQVALVVQHVLKARGAIPLGQFSEVRGYQGGARLWALRDQEWLKSLTHEGLVNLYAANDNKTVERFRRPDHQAGDDAVQWLHDHVAVETLPTLAYAPEIAATIPDAEFWGLTDGQRGLCAQRFLTEIGAKCLGEHLTDEGRRKLWATRDIERLEALKPRQRVETVFGRVSYVGNRRREAVA
jgi:hypothetical protein